MFNSTHIPMMETYFLAKENAELCILFIQNLDNFNWNNS